MARSLSPLGSWLRRAADVLFGYDYFISYAHADGHGYARRLAEQLDELGFSVFLDTRVYVAGDDLQAATRRRIRMSKKLVAVVRPKALESEWVLREIQVCLAAGRLPIAIDVAGTLARAPEDNPAKILLKDKLYITDPGGAAEEEPAADVTAKLARSFDATRQETLRVRALALAALVFAVVAAVAVWQFRQARISEQLAIKNAIQFYDFCSAARQQIAGGQVKLDDLERETEFGRLVARIARDVAQLPEPEEIECGQDPRAPAPGG